MGVSLGLITIKINEDEDPVTVKGVHTFLTDINDNELYIVHNLYKDKEIIQVVPSSKVLEFNKISIIKDDWTTFYNTTYNLILIVLEKLILSRIFESSNYYINDLMKDYLERNQEVNESKININII